MKKLLAWVRALWQKRIYRVLLMGVAGALFQTIVFTILVVWLAVLRPSIAVLISTETGVLFNFYLNNRFSFNDRTHARLALRLLRFHTTVTGSFFCQWLFVFLTERVTSNAYALLVAYGAGILIGFISNYTGYRLWVWKHHKEPTVI